MEREAAWQWVELEIPLEISEDTSLEVVVGAPLELVGEQERTGWAWAGKGVASSGRGHGVD